MINIMRRDREAKTEKLGTIDWVGGKLVVNLPSRIESFIKSLTKLTSKKDVDNLPKILRGDRLWAAKG